MDEIFSICLEEELTHEENEGIVDSNIAQLTTSASIVDLETMPPIHPILKLPPEIICHIFHFTLPDFSICFSAPLKNYHLLPKKYQTATPFILGAVCQYWRANRPVDACSLVHYGLSPLTSHSQ